MRHLVIDWQDVNHDLSVELVPAVSYLDDKAVIHILRVIMYIHKSIT